MLDSVKERIEDKLKKHPIAYAVVGLILALVNIFIWLAGVWSNFSDEKLPTVFLRLGVPRMSLYTSAILLFIFTVSSIGLFIAILLAVRRHKKALGWLEALADEDNQYMSQRIFLRHSYAVQYFNAVADPYIVLKVIVINTSVFTLTLEEKVEGKIHFRGGPLKDDAKVYLAKTETMLVTVPNIKHGQEIEVSVRQSLPHHLVDNFIGEEKFESGGAALHFTYQDHTGATQRVRISLGNAPFIVKA